MNRRQVLGPVKTGTTDCSIDQPCVLGEPCFERVQISLNTFNTGGVVFDFFDGVLGVVFGVDGINDSDNLRQAHHDKDSDDHFPPFLSIFQDGTEGRCDGFPAGVLVGVPEALPQKAVVSNPI